LITLVRLKGKTNRWNPERRMSGDAQPVRCAIIYLLLARAGVIDVVYDERRKEDWISRT
jgi:hypothetical protein